MQKELFNQIQKDYNDYKRMVNKDYRELEELDCLCGSIFVLINDEQDFELELVNNFPKKVTDSSLFKKFPLLGMIQLCIFGMPVEMVEVNVTKQMNKIVSRYCKWVKQNP